MALTVTIYREFDVTIGDRKSAVLITADLLNTVNYEVWIAKNGEKAKKYQPMPDLVNHDLQTQMAFLQQLAELCGKENEIISVEVVEETIQITINQEVNINETTIQKKRN